MTGVAARFMTVNPLSPVGCGEVKPLGDWGRLFACALIVVGVGAALYTAGALGEFLIAGPHARTAREKIEVANAGVAARPRDRVRIRPPRARGRPRALAGGRRGAHVTRLGELASRRG
jgi:hypothetical protein